MGENTIHKEIQTREKTDIKSESFQSTDSYPAQAFIPRPETRTNLCMH
jgi:hypothetical protein